MRIRIRERFDPGSEMEKILIRAIPDPQHCYLLCSAGGQTPLARLSGTDFVTLYLNIFGSDKEDPDPDSRR
jgi:hypothetical protein